MDSIPEAGEEIFWCPNMFSLVSFAGIRAPRPSDLDVNWRLLVEGKSPSVRVKEPYSSLYGYL